MNVNFKEGEQDQFTTWFGSFISIIVLITVFIYSKNKFVILANYEDTRYQTITEKPVAPLLYTNEIETDFPFGAFTMSFINKK